MEEKTFVDQNGLIYKTQSYLKHQNRLVEVRQEKAKKKLQSIRAKKRVTKISKEEQIKKPEEFVYQNRHKRMNYVNFIKRKRKATKGDFSQVQSRPLFVVRIQGEKNMSKNQKSLFNKLQLKSQHDGRIFIETEELLKTLKSLENMIIFGYPNQETLKNLIQKRGFISKEDKVIAINSNKIIEEVFNNKDIICIEDLISSLLYKSKETEQILSQICTFKLTKPTEGYGDKFQSFEKEGSWGNRKENINQLLSKMI